MKMGTEKKNVEKLEVSCSVGDHVESDRRNVDLGADIMDEKGKTDLMK